MKAICIRKYLYLFERYRLYRYKEETLADDYGNIIAEYTIRVPLIKQSLFPNRIRAVQLGHEHTYLSITRKAFKYHFREFL